MRVVVQHVPGQRAETMDAILRVIPGAVVVECAGDPWSTWLRVLMAEPAGHWHVEDDAVLAPDFLYRGEEAIKQADGLMVQGFGRGRQCGIRPGSSFLFNVCLWLPDGYGPAIAEYAEAWPRHGEHPTGFDLCIRDWLVSRSERYWQACPSLAEHAVGPSLLGPRAKDRGSVTFREAYGRG